MRIGRKHMTTAALGRLAATTAIAFTAMGASSALADDQVRLWVDAGHGGKDPGAVAGGLSEKDSNMQVQKHVIDAARRQGWKVGTTRDTDDFVSLNERPKRANGWKADAMVSLHSNSAGAKPTGHMTIYRSEPGKRLGKDIMNELAPLTKYEDIGNRADSRGLAVLRGAKVPTVIVELLSVSNAQERQQLKSPTAQREMAEAIVRGVARNKGVEYVPPKAATKPAKPAEPTAEATAAPAAAPAAKKAPNAEPAAKPAAPAEKPATGGKPAADAKAADAAKAVVEQPVAKRTTSSSVLADLWRLLFG